MPNPSIFSCTCNTNYNILIIYDADLAVEDLPSALRRSIVPGGYSPQKINIQKRLELSDLVDQVNYNI